MKKLVVLVALAVALSAMSVAGASAAYVELGSFANNGSGDGGAGSENGQLRSPGAADVRASDGKLYVADTNNDRVEVFAGTATGGTYDGQVAIPAPAGLAIDQSTGDVYVSNPSGVSKFDADLNPVAGWHVAETGTLAVDPITHDLLVADIGASLIRRYSSAGVTGPTFVAARPLDVAVDSTGDVLVVTSTGDIIGDCGATSAVERFTGAGVSEGLIGSLEAPGSVAVDPDDDGVVVGAVVNQWNCGTQQPVVAQFAADGTPGPVTTLAADALYAMVPGLAAVGGGSSRIYAVTKSPFDDAFGATAVRVLQDIAPPTVSDPTLSNLTGEQVEVSAGVNPNGTNTTWKFELSSDGGATWTASPGGNAGAGSTLVTISATLPGLQPKTDYRVRTIADNGIEVTSGETAFTTPAVAPNAQTQPATGVTKASAKLNATIDPQGSATTYWFEYGTTTAYGNSVPVAQNGDAGSGNAPIDVTQTSTGLQPATTYHYRVVAESDQGVARGGDRTFTTGSAAGAVVPDGCPNAAVRAQQGSAYLPDCRAFELVSPSQDGADNNRGGLALVSDDGTAVGYQAATGLANAVNGTGGAYRARRSAGRWESESLAPAFVRGEIINPSSEPLIGAFSRDLSQTLFIQGDNHLSPELPEGVGRALYLRDKNGGLTRITAPTSASPNGTPTFHISGTSSNLDHIVFEGGVNFAGTITPGPIRLVSSDAARVRGSGVYDYTGGHLESLGVLPNGDIPADGAVPAIDPSTTGAQDRYVVSRDGRRVVFQTPTPNVGSTEVARLYQRIDGARTVLVSRSMITGEPATDGSTMLGASPDGTVVWFASREQLTSDAPTGVTSTYRFDVATETVTYEPDLDQGPVALSTDGARIYYLKKGTQELWTRTGASAPTKVADVDEYFALFPTYRQFWVSDDGARLLFLDGVPARPGQFNHTGDFNQLYRYTAGDGALACVSCPPDGTPVTGDAIVAARETRPYAAPVSGRWVAADGEHVYFTSPDALVDDDVNGVNDVYQWRDGQVRLLTTGTHAYASELADVNPSEDSVVFTTRNRLDAADAGGLDVYMARVNGGFPKPVPAVPCDLDCQGPAQVHGAPSPAGSAQPKPGNPQQAERSAKPSRATTVTAPTRVTGARVNVRVKVRTAGKITVTGSLTQRAARATKRATTYALKISLSKAAKRRLQVAGTVKAKLRIVFTPKGQAAVVHSITVTFKKSPSRGAGTKGGR